MKPRMNLARPSAATKGPKDLATTKVTKIRKSRWKAMLFTFVILVTFVVQIHSHENYCTISEQMLIRKTSVCELVVRMNTKTG